MKKRTRRKIRLEAVFNAVTSPVFLLDRRRTVRFFNSGCEQLTGWTADEVVGEVCCYAGEQDPKQVTSLTGSLCPPPEVFDGQPAHVPTDFLHRDGESFARLVDFYPLNAAKGRVEHVLGLITSIAAPQPPAASTPARQLHAELTALRIALRHRFGPGTLVGQCEAMIRVMEQIKAAQATTSALLLAGEPGTGKEHVARLIHYEGKTRARAFVPLDCLRLGALELKRALRRLFDEEEQPHPGDFPADSSLLPGTVFLANVESLPRDLQRDVVGAFTPEGPRERPDLRLMAATTGSIEQAVADETVRNDFYYLVTPLRIELPPLRRRGEDLGLLSQAFLEDLNCSDEKQIGGFSEEVREQFHEYNWPGNLDELAAVIKEAWTACTGGLIQLGDLPFRFRTGLDAQAVGPRIESDLLPLETLLKKVETEQIERVLEQTRYNKSKAAALLGITRPRLYRRMQALGIDDLEETT